MSHSKIIDLRERCGKQASSNDSDKQRPRHPTRVIVNYRSNVDLSETPLAHFGMGEKLNGTLTRCLLNRH